MTTALQLGFSIGDASVKRSCLQGFLDASREATREVHAIWKKIFSSCDQENSPSESNQQSPHGHATHVLPLLRAPIGLHDLEFVPGNGAVQQPDVRTHSADISRGGASRIRI